MAGGLDPHRRLADGRRARGHPAEGIDAGTDAVLEVAAEVLGLIRREKTTAKRSMRAPVARLVVTDTPSRIDALCSAEHDLRQAGGVIDLVTREGDALSVEVELAEE